MSTPGPYPPGQPGYQQPVYVQPVYQGYAEDRPPKRLNGTQVVRAVLILAALAGLATVATGLMLWLGAPEEYAAPERTKLKLQAGELAPSVGPGGPGDPLTQAVPTAPPPAPNLPPAPAMQPSTPKRLIIARLGINAPIKSVGLDKHGVIETPPVGNANLVGWYRGGPTAGEAGPAVMLGHKDTRTGIAVFARLHELRYGDTVEVIRMDDTIAVYTVGGIEQANKQTFPTHRVYGDSDAPELRLITCGGTYNRATGHYVDNVIVYATMTGTRLAYS